MKKATVCFMFVVCLILLASLCFAAGSSVTQSGTGYGVSKVLNAGGDTGSKVLTLLLTSDDAAGTVTGAISQDNMDQINGMWITLVECMSGADAVQASDQYDLTLTTALGIDVMGGALADRSNAATGDQALPDCITGATNSYGPRQITSALTINGSGMGNSKQVTVRINMSR